MAFSLILVQKITAMLIWAMLGYIMVRIKMLDSGDSKIISKLLIWTFQPCLIARAFIVELNREKLTGFLAGLAFAFATEFIWIIVTRLIRKPLHLTTVDSANLIYTNCGNLVVPLVAMSLGEEYVFYIAAYQVCFNILLWTHGVVLIKGVEAISFKKVILNTNVLAIVIGSILMITQFRLPSIIDTASEGLANMVGPSSMIVIGMTIAAADLKSIFRIKRAYLITFIRLFAYPCMIMLILFATGILRRQPLLTPIFMALMLCVAAPPASLVTQLAVLYDNEPYQSSACNIMCTFVSIASIPAIITLYQLVFHV